MQKDFSDSVYVNSCPLFPVPCSLFPTTAAKSTIKIILHLCNTGFFALLNQRRKFFHQGF
ncbi:MAG: hypothetical protein F6K56_09345 [Moorea sp. SIO3G5]|nr:hypothetical protein [Moorena sp. SIO3G5]